MTRSESVRARAHRKPAFQTITRILDGIDRFLPDNYKPVKAEDLLSSARRRTQLFELPDLSFMEPLTIWLQSIHEETRLRKPVRMIAHHQVIASLSTKLRLESEFTKQPEILEAPVTRPIFIASLPRTGTTLLQRLLSQDPLARPLIGWESLQPIRTGIGKEGQIDPRILRARRIRKFGHWFTSAVQIAHDFDPEQPEECGPLLRGTFVSPIDCLALETYRRWYLRQDQNRLAEGYRDYQRVLQYLQWERPVPENGHWLLKSPFHIYALPAILKLFPDATIILIHRDPTEVVTSFCSLMSYFYDVLLRLSPTDRLEMMHSTVDWCEEGMHRAESARAADAGTGRIYDVSYSELVRDPIAVIRDFYSRREYPYSTEFEGKMREWISENPRGKHGGHRYSPEQFGFKESELRARFDWYREAHEIPSIAQIAETIPVRESIKGKRVERINGSGGVTRDAQDKSLRVDRYAASISDFQSYLARQLIATNIGVYVVEFDGAIDTGQLRRALRLLFDAEPVLGCRYVLSQPPYWQRRLDLEEITKISVASGEEMEQTVLAFISSSIDPCKETLVQAMIARDKTDKLYVKISHVVADGPSWSPIVRLLSSIYRELSKNSEYHLPIPNETDRDIRLLTRSFKLIKKLGILRGIREEMALPRFSWRCPETADDPTFWGYLVMKLPKARGQLLKSYAQSHRATLTVVLLAGFFQATQRTMEPVRDDVSTITTTTDLRRFLKGGFERTGPSNFIGPISLNIESAVDLSFDDIVGRFVRQLADGLRDPALSARVPSVALAILGLDKLVRRLPVKMLRERGERMLHRVRSDPLRRMGMSNLGDIRPSTIDFGGPKPRDAYILGPIFYGPGLLASFSTYCEEITIGIGFSGKVAPISVVQQLLRELDQALPGWTGEPAQITLLDACHS